MKKFKISVIAIAFATSMMLLTSCVGSFSLFNKVLTWDKGKGKVMGEVIYLVFWILPVYETCWAADAIVFNTIEFWTGKKFFSMNNNEKVDKLVNVNGKLIKVECSNRKVVFSDLTPGGTKFELYFDTDNNCYLTSGNIRSKVGEYMKDVNDNLVYLNLTLPGKSVIKMGKKTNFNDYDYNLMIAGNTITKELAH